MAEADPFVRARDPADHLLPRGARRRVRPSWIAGFLIAIAALWGFAAFALDGYRSGRWAPQPVEPRAARSAIKAGVQAHAAHLIDYDRLDARLAQLMSAPDMVGLAIGIVENGEVSFVKGYGTTEAGKGAPVTPATVFRWASLSKGVAATMVARLAAEKKLSLNDPIARWSSSLKLPGGAERTVTVADVLSHRLGIVHNAYDDKLEEGIDPRAIRTMLATLDPFCPPSTCHAYQNVGFDAASEVVAKATGVPYAKAVQQQLFAPLGMTSAHATRGGLEGSASWARPHRGQRELRLEDAYFRVPAAGGVSSSIFDLALWMRAQMGEAPRVLSPTLLETIHFPRVTVERRHASRFDNDFRDPHYALGWRDMEYHGHRLYGHRGAVSGYRSLILFDPALKVGVVALWNSESIKPVGAQLEVFDMLYRLPPKDWLAVDPAPAGKPRR